MRDADLAARLQRIEARLGLLPPVQRAAQPRIAGCWDGARYLGPRVEGCGCEPEGECVRPDCPHGPDAKIPKSQNA